MICKNLKGWGGVYGGWEVQKGGNICIPKADSSSCMAETNTILKTITLQLKLSF